MNQTKKELSYFRLKLEAYLSDYHPELMTDTAFITARADAALTAYADAVTQGFSPLEAEALKRQKAIENEERSQALKAPFFGIAFTDGTIEACVLESVEEYLEEDKALHHYVFTNEYYLKEKNPIGSH